MGSALLKSIVLSIQRINDVYVFSIYTISYRKTTTFQLHLNCLFCCNHTFYCANMVCVTSASRHITSASLYHPCYQSRFSMYICGLIPRYFMELAGAVPIALVNVDACARPQMSEVNASNVSNIPPDTLSSCWKSGYISSQMMCKMIPSFQDVPILSNYDARM